MRGRLTRSACFSRTATGATGVGLGCAGVGADASGPKYVEINFLAVAGSKSPERQSVAFEGRQ